jgi:hypothetical protein
VQSFLLAAINWHRIFSAQFHGVPVIGIALLIFLASLVLKAVLRLARSLIAIGIIVAVLIMFAPALLGKQGAADLHQTTQSLSACTGSLSGATLKSLLNCSKQAVTPSERAQAKAAYQKARKAALARAKAKAAAKAK